MLETRIYLTNQLGSLLKDYRKSQNISQKELAERTQICQSRISFLENHPENISIGQLMRWLSVLGLEIKIAVKKDEPMKQSGDLNRRLSTPHQDFF